MIEHLLRNDSLTKSVIGSDMKVILKEADQIWSIYDAIHD